MSTQAAKQFLEKVAGDKGLQERLASKQGKPEEQLASAIEAGRTNGFAFTADEFQSVVKAQLNPGEGPLDERSLAQVAGGLSTFQYWLGMAYSWLGGSAGSDSGGGTAVGVRG